VATPFSRSTCACSPRTRGKCSNVSWNVFLESGQHELSSYVSSPTFFTPAIVCSISSTRELQPSHTMPPTFSCTSITPAKTEEHARCVSVCRVHKLDSRQQGTHHTSTSDSLSHHHRRQCRRLPRHAVTALVGR
jgi:hypothetical protein